MGQVQVREKRRMYRTGSGQREEKDVSDRFKSERREECTGQVQVREKRRIDRTGSGKREDFTPDQRDQDGFTLKKFNSSKKEELK